MLSSECRVRVKLFGKDFSSYYNENWIKGFEQASMNPYRDSTRSIIRELKREKRNIGKVEEEAVPPSILL